MLSRLFGRDLEGCAGHVAAGSTQAYDELEAHGISNAGEHDRDSAGRLLNRERGRRSGRIDHIDLGVDQFPRQLRKALDFPLGRPVLEEKGLSLDVPQLA